MSVLGLWLSSKSDIVDTKQIQDLNYSYKILPPMCLIQKGPRWIRFGSAGTGWIRSQVKIILGWKWLESFYLPWYLLHTCDCLYLPWYLHTCDYLWPSLTWSHLASTHYPPSISWTEGWPRGDRVTGERILKIVGGTKFREAQQMRGGHLMRDSGAPPLNLEAC